MQIGGVERLNALAEEEEADDVYQSAPDPMGCIFNKEKDKGHSSSSFPRSYVHGLGSLLTTLPTYLPTSPTYCNFSAYRMQGMV